MSRTPALLVALLLVPGATILSLAPGATAAHTYYDVRIVSFDNTQLAATVFLPEGASEASPVPFVLMTHGWAGQRVKEPTGRVEALLDAGYGVVTWDSRGFGESGGNVELNSPEFEGKDVSAIVTYVARRLPSIHTGTDPVVGMTGGSYAGGIQLIAAAFDDRIDAIAPEITWHDLAESLAPNGVPKLYWTTLLFAAGLESSCLNARNGNPAGALQGAVFPIYRTTDGCQTSDLARYFAEVHATNSVSDEVREALLARSPKTYMSEIDIPTLLVSGFPDTLFDADQAAQNYAGIKANGAPVKLWLYDGGHAHPEGPALPNTQADLITPLVVSWFDRWLKADLTVDTGPEVEYYAGGAWRSAPSWPDPAATTNTRFQAGIPVLTQGPVTGGTPATFSFKLADGPATLAGPATLSFDVSGLGPEGFLFASLSVVDAAGAATVANHQVQPVRFAQELEGLTSVTMDLVSVEANVPAGSSLVVNFATFDRNYNGNRAPGYSTLQNIDLEWTTV